MEASADLPELERKGARGCMKGRCYIPRQEQNETNERHAVAGGGVCGGVDMALAGKRRWVASKGRHAAAVSVGMGSFSGGGDVAT